MLEYWPEAQNPKGGDHDLLQYVTVHVAFMVPLMNCSSPVLAALMQPQTMTLPPPCLTIGKTNLSEASGLDINGSVLSYFDGTANVHFYTNFTLTTLHCSKV